MRRHAHLFGDFAQTIGIRTVYGADHQHDVDLATQFANRSLTVLGRITDVAGVGADEIVESDVSTRR